MSMPSQSTATYWVAIISGLISISVGVLAMSGRVSPSWFTAVLALIMALSMSVSSWYSRKIRL